MRIRDFVNRLRRMWESLRETAGRVLREGPKGARRGTMTTAVFTDKSSLLVEQVLPSSKLSAAERELLAQVPREIDFVYNERFPCPSSEYELFGEEQGIEEYAATVSGPPSAIYASAPSRAAPAPDSCDQERLFLRYNYARYRLAGLLAEPTRRASNAGARHMIVWHRRAADARDQLVRQNLPLVIAVARRACHDHVEFAELVAEGNVALLRAIDRFDVSRGARFSTYAWSAIRRRLARLARTTGRYRSHFPVEFDPELERADGDAHRQRTRRDEAVWALRETLNDNRAGLSSAERTVLRERFGIGTEHEGRTLSDIGQTLGLTPERIRQIQNAALAKIRRALK